MTDEKKVIIQVPVTETEKRELKKLAIDKGTSMGDMLRSTILDSLLK